jgi:hypothetical protein
MGGGVNPGNVIKFGFGDGEKLGKTFNGNAHFYEPDGKLSPFFPVPFVEKFGQKWEECG